MASLYENNAAPHNFVMDNARIQTAPVVKDLFQNSRHKLHLLLPYSPFPNPIEECFSKLKTSVKRKPELTGDAYLKHISECSKEIARENSTDPECHKRSKQKIPNTKIQGVLYSIYAKFGAISFSFAANASIDVFFWITVYRDITETGELHTVTAAL
ncbi:hypothetical protein [Parasitella parasitica]|uniref:Tc1-like transposase DDE domain-containing protein n=1 Tax=Parasitella parasitica TaxID=35722 RepID=A0A0B7NC02_9FUNG|nr:hypothetical protein [Parasitella parasitica]